MTTSELIYRIQQAYPRIYHACHVDHAQAPSGLSQRNVTILAHIDSAVPLTQTQLARHLGINKSTMSEAVKFLAAQGYVALEADADLRAHRLTLTDSGRRAMGAGSVLDGGRLAALLATLDEEETRIAIAGLEMLARGCARLAQQAKET